MDKAQASILRNINFRREIFEMIQVESCRRNNGLRGFSLTVNQIVLEYFEARNKEKKLEPVHGTTV